MQALTPLLFSMLFSRSGNKSPITERDYPVEGSNYSYEALSNGQSVRRASSGSFRNNTHRQAFQDGYPIQDLDSQQNPSTNAPRHRSAGSTRRCSSDPNMNKRPNNAGLNRNNTFPQSRRAAPPQHLSLDHAAFMATFPMLDGLGDTTSKRMSDLEYYAPILNYHGTASSPSSRRVSKKRSQEIASSRSSTCSISSMVSDASTAASTVSSASSIREPLTPTRHSTNYRNSLSKKTKKAATESTIKDLINLDNFGDDEVMRCASPLSHNAFEEDQAVLAGSAIAVVGARGQRQLIAH
ncbi:hypothetical protein BX616_000318 [Lobosporangium transversale]|nr:hypothetical protein BX616_000318 [Lobosporangium transversale]